VTKTQQPKEQDTKQVFKRVSKGIQGQPTGKGF
jgi:hypothetical protein